VQCYFNLLALDGLAGRSYENIRQAGYDGVQFAGPASESDLSLCRSLRLSYAASGRVNHPRDAATLAEGWSGKGFTCATLHVGWGIESNAEASRLIESILEASVKYKTPLYVETHRATIFQDMWRSVEFVRQFPQLLFNGDFSHWYTGQEMVYGGFEAKRAFIEPVLERVRFLHGRIGTPGCIQVRIDAGAKEAPSYVQHFRELWTACFRHGTAIFTPELLAPNIYYARIFPDSRGVAQEESDRWEQSLLLKKIAEECFAEAKRG